MRNAEQLHESAVHRCIPSDCPATDGLGLLGVGIDIGSSIWADFQLWFLVDLNGRIGNSAAPSRFTVGKHADQVNSFLRPLGADSGTLMASFGILDLTDTMVDSFGRRTVITIGRFCTRKITAIPGCLAGRPNGGRAVGNNRVHVHRSTRVKQLIH